MDLHSYTFLFENSNLFLLLWLSVHMQARKNDRKRHLSKMRFKVETFENASCILWTVENDIFENTSSNVNGSY